MAATRRPLAAYRILFPATMTVMTFEGMLVDLGSFRSSAGFLTDFRHHRNRTQESFSDRGDYIEF